MLLHIVGVILFYQGIKMINFIRLIFVIMVFLATVFLPTIVSAQMNINDAITSIDANVIFMRHALAPGTGDPYHFNIKDCGTQRNLNDVGRAQAREIGAYLKDNNIKFTQILSSQWCRCVDTVIEMDIASLSPKPWQVFFGLNSFFDGHVDEAAVLNALNKKLANMPKEGEDKGALVLMVTHQVVITAITDIFPASGDMVAYNSHSKASQEISVK